MDMIRIHYTAILLVCLYATSAVFAQSLGPDYNLGRVTGGPMASQDLQANQANGTTLLGDVFSLRFGKESYHQVDWTGSAFYRDASAHPTVAVVPMSVRGVVRPDFGHQLEASFYTPVFSYWYLDGRHQSGLTDSLKTPLSYSLRYDMLTREGHIDVRPYEYEWTFRRGPLVDEGEFRSHIEFQTHVLDMAEENTDYYSFNWSPALGLWDGVQLGFDYNVGWRDNEDAAKSLRWSLEMRYDQFYLENMLAAGSQKFGDLFQKESNTWEVRAGMVLGNRGLSFQNVNGNWDHTFNPMMGFGQLLVEVYNLQSLNWDVHEKRAGGTVLGGILPFLTVGASGSWQNREENARNTYHSTLHVNLANPSVREEGPSDVAAMEYRKGYIPRAGKFQFYNDFGLPFHKGPVQYTGSAGSDPFENILTSLVKSPIQSSDANQDQAFGNAFVRSTLRVGVTSFLYLSSETSYFPDGFTWEEQTSKDALWESLKLGAYTFPYFIAEAGLCFVHADNLDLGPVFVKVMHTF